MSSRRPSISNGRHESRQSSNSRSSREIETEIESELKIRSETDLQFPIYVESITGTTFRLDVFPTDTIQQIKQQLENTEGIPVCRQHIIWQYEELTDELTIEEYGICFGARLRLVIDLITGPVSKSRLSFDKRSDIEQNSSEDEFPESKPLTILLFQNKDQIQLISITTNDRIIFPISDSPSNYLGSDDDLSKTLNNEEFDSKERENQELKDKMNEIQNQMKLLLLKRSKNKINKIDGKEQINSYRTRNKTTNVPKLPHLETNAIDYSLINFKTQTKPEFHLPSISNTGNSHSFEDNLWNESTRREDKTNSIKPVLMTSNDSEIVSSKRRLSLTSNNNIIINSKDMNALEMSSNWRFSSIRKQRPLTAPAVHTSDDTIDLDFINKLSNIRSKHLSFKQIGVKTKKLNSGRRLPPIPNNSKKKVHKIRCSLCRIKLGIVNRYNCRCGLIFCAKHRYSETHFCSYDYKEEGKKYLKKVNPIITADKLPKI